MVNELFNVEKMKFIDKFFKYITYDEIKGNNKYLLLDLRTMKEFNEKHLEDSINFPLLSDSISIKLEGMFLNRTYFTTSIKGLFYIIPRLSHIRSEIKKYEEKSIIVLGCRHARIRSRSIAMFVNIFGSKTLVLKGGVTPLVSSKKL
ncbi:MAG: rhodanese-like domain-containing protein [Clostridium sp.]|uniref:rhodanese-like domain-containing protein n=1 Tax=Clostridium sp. TaxID=1506 RepID=UPI003F2C08BE